MEYRNFNIKKTRSILHFTLHIEIKVYLCGKEANYVRTRTENLLRQSKQVA